MHTRTDILAQVDLITAAIGTVRVGRANGRRISEIGPSGVRIPPMPRIGFHIMLSGEGWLITTDDEPAPLRAGDVVFTSAGAEHGLARTPTRLAELPPIVMGEVPPPPAPVDFEFLCGAYVLQPNELPALLRSLPPVFAFTPDYDRHPELRSLVRMLSDNYDERGPGTEAARAALIDLMMVHILRAAQENGSALAAEPGIAEALQEMHERPEQPWTVQRLSEVARMSRTGFVRRFRSVAGDSPIAYLTALRLTSAAHLLRETDAPLSAVARRIGYSTEFAFAAAFRRRYGVPPGHYRRHARAG